MINASTTVEIDLDRYVDYYGPDVDFPDPYLDFPDPYLDFPDPYLDYKGSLSRMITPGPGNSDDQWAAVWPQWMDAVSHCPISQRFLADGLSVLGRRETRALDASILSSLCQQMDGVNVAAIVKGSKGQWKTQTISQHGLSVPNIVAVGDEWLSDVLDNASTKTRQLWIATPLAPRGATGQLLLVQVDDAKYLDPIVKQISSLAAATGMLMSLAQRLDHGITYTQHLLGLLEMTATWNRSQDTDSLLLQMAETSTRWIPSERATIFLWDRSAKQLVGKPALGVEGGELRIADDSGLVGQVVQTATPGRVDVGVAAEQAQVDRRTDKQLNFQTRSLLCVPLVNEAGQCLGAFELINKIGGDFSDQDQQSLEQLAKHAAIAIANRTRVDRLVTTQKTAATEAASSVQFRGSCDPIRSLKKTILRVAPTELSVLLLGENGTGKEVAAQLLHFSSERRDEVLIAVNCAAIPENLLESELFGHEKGAFTDAQQTRQGKFELASLGTIFLDEIGDMSLAGQAKLLRVLEEKTIVRVGGSQTIPTNSRVVAATNQNLAELVRQRKFREDLFFRLNVVTLEIPPLRIRGNDILELAQFFMETFSVQARRNVPTLSLAVQKKLLSHPWPGNVRELRNMMERLVFLTSEDRIEVEDLSFITSPSREANTLDLELPLNDATRLFQIQYITQQIQQSHGSMTLAAQRMGLHRTNLYRKMKQLGLSVDES